MQDDDLIDHAETLRFLHPDMLTDDCQVVVDARQFQVLIDILDRVRKIGDVGFRLEA